MQLLWGLARFVLAMAVAVPVFALVFRSMDRPPAPMWERSSGQAVPADFKYLMFPLHPADSILRDDARGPSTALQRAVMNTEEEVRAGGRVHVNGPMGQGLSVELSDLRFLPPTDSSIDYVRRWNDDLVQRGAEVRAGRFDIRWGEGRRIVNLRFRQRMNDVRCEYETDGATAIPMAMWEESAASGRELGALALASLSMLGAATVVLAVTGRVFRWRSGKPAANRP